MKIAYIDHFFGISGNLFVGALLDAGLPFEVLEKALVSLPLEGVALEMEKVERNGLCGTRFLVRADQNRLPPTEGSPAREIIDHSDLTKRAKEKCIHVLERGDAGREGITALEPHSVVSLVEIVGTVLGMESMGICSLSACLSPSEPGLLRGPVTSNGIALLGALAGRFGSMPRMTVEGVGYGLGCGEPPDPTGFLRMVVGYEHSEQYPETVVILEAVLGNVNPEWLGFLMDRLLGAGALDVVFCPVQSGKGRPGILILVLGRPQQKDGLAGLLLREAGPERIRFRYSERRALERSQAELQSPWGKLKVKRVLRPNGKAFLLPEFQACQRIATENNLPLNEIYAWVLSIKSP